jgi:CRISPR/Cas system-associated exonuclease Cas4 (RecB family)
VNPEHDGFRTALPDVDGIWPALPRRWSFSSLTQAGECPRRWTLARASYPKVWDRSGYPSRPVLPALVGGAVHHVLEVVLAKLHAENCASVSDPRTAAVLKELGGYTALLEDAVDRELARLTGNPRAAQVLDAVAAGLRQRIPAMRQRVQVVIARAKLNPAPLGAGTSSRPEERLPLAKGTHPEVELQVPALRFVGRADLLSLEDDACTITDYKTGSPGPHHLEQIRIYALLWTRDEDLNPSGIPATRLVIGYATHDDVYDAPPSAELQKIAADLTARIREAETELSSRPPPAKPAAEMCQLCAVRHLCDDYWPSEAAKANSPAVAPLGSFVDCEATITHRNGPRSWLIALERDDSSALLRTASAARSFHAGDRVRLLDVVHGKDEDNDTTILTMTQMSEAYVVRPL